MKTQTNETKHTAGTWQHGAPHEVTEGAIVLYAGKQATPIGEAYVSIHDSREGEANARLIAQAPALLLVLKMLVGLHDQQFFVCGCDDEQQAAGTLKIARAAIARATGGTP